MVKSGVTAKEVYRNGQHEPTGRHVAVMCITVEHTITHELYVLDDIVDSDDSLTDLVARHRRRMDLFYMRTQDFMRIPPLPDGPYDEYIHVG